MKGKIALEEHFATEETVGDGLGFFPSEYRSELRSRLLDIQHRRIERMDQNGIELTILSLNAPAVQAIADPKKADELAQRANDFLAHQVSQCPNRLQAFAALPMQDPDLAARELERCIKQLGFKGALVNGFSQTSDPTTALYYDLQQYWPFWSLVESLGVPFYLHPRSPLPAHAQIYAGHEWLLAASWAFGHETAVHALRLMGSGLFDQYPRLQIILGHLGEGLPYSLWRIDHNRGWVNSPRGHRATKNIADYFQSNFYLTTSGNFRSQSLIDAMLEIGADRIMFSSDWPFETMDHAAAWFDSAPISESDRKKIGRGNAISLFKLESVL